MRIAAVLLALLLVACGDEAPACLGRIAPEPDGDFVIEVKDDGAYRVVRYRDGSEVRVPSDPKRIVSTLPGITGMLVAFGAGTRLAAVTQHCVVPEGRDDIRRISVMPLDLETLAAVQADLVFVDGVVRGTDLGSGAGPGPAVVRLESQSVPHLWESADLIQALVPEASMGWVDWVAELTNARAGVVLDRPHQFPRAPRRVLLVAQAEPLYVLGPGSLLDDLLRECGAINVACDLGRPSGPFSEELVLVRRPDVILSFGGPLPAALRERWAPLPAASRIVVLEGDHLLQAGVGTPRALSELDAAVNADFEEDGR